MLFALWAATHLAGAPFALDPKRTTIAFQAEQAIFGKTDGRFRSVKGDFDLYEDDIARSKFSVQIEASSVHTGNNDRDAHLKKKDFFHVDKFPTIVFQSEAVSGTKARVKVRGGLTIKDQTIPVEFELDLTWTGSAAFRTVQAKGSFEVDRYKAGLNYDTPFFIPEISQMIKMTIDVTAIAAKSDAEENDEPQ